MPFLSTRRGKLTLALLCSIAFVDFVDASIVNLALPSIRHDLHFSTRSLVWVPSAYLLTYGGLMLLGGRAADLLGRRRVLIAGTVLIGVASLVGGLAQSSSVLVGARLAQGVGAAAMLPTALSILTTLFREGRERNLALGAWGGVGGISSAIGVLAGGALTEGPGWRWVFFVNPFACLLVVAASFALLDGQRPETRLEGFDLPGAILSTAGALLAIYALVSAPTVGWGNARTIGEIAGAVVLFAGFAINELRQRNPLVPPALFRIKGIAVANITQLFAFCGFLSIFFFLTLYMRGMLGYSPIKVGAAYLPALRRRLSRRGRRRPSSLTCRSAADDRYRRAHSGGRHLLALAHPCARVLPLRRPAGNTAPRRRHGTGVGWGRVRRYLRGRRRRSRPRSVPAQRLTATWRRPRPRRLERARQQPNRRPARTSHTRISRPRLGLPAGASRRQHLPRVRSRDRPASEQHARRNGRAARQRTGTSA
jgi:MFS family permease